MSFQRKAQRMFVRTEMHRNGMRKNCRHCDSKMIVKDGYGWVCPQCGWWPSVQKNAWAELNGGMDDGK